MSVTASSRPRATLVALALLAAVAAGSRVGATDASWTDRSYVKGNFGALKWGTTGAATGAAVTAGMTISVLGTGSVGPIGPMASSSATPATPSPAAGGGALVTTSGLSLNLVGGSSTGFNVATSAAYSQTAADATSSATSVEMGISALGLALLGNVANISAASGNLQTGASCRANSASSATATDLTSLRVSMLGAVAVAPSVVGNTATANLVQLTSLDLTRVTVGVTITRTVSVTSAPADPTASASLSAVVVVSVDTRVTTLTAWTPALGVTMVAPMISSSCSLDLP